MQATSVTASTYTTNTTASTAVLNASSYLLINMQQQELYSKVQGLLKNEWLHF